MKQLGEAQAALKEFKLVDTVIFGVNQESVVSHRDFAEEEGYTFALISDVDNRIAKAYALKVMDEYPDLMRRTVYVIDTDGVIQFAEEGNPSTDKLMKIIEMVN